MAGKGLIANLKPWKKGQSGNPAGIRKPCDPEVFELRRADRIFLKSETAIIENLSESAKRLAAKALFALEDALDHPEASQAVRVTAAKEIFDRGFGKAVESVKAEIGLDLAWLLRRGRERAEQAKLIEGTKTDVTD